MNEVNLNFIRCFQILSETLNFSEAASRLRLAQSNVSRQIKILEDALGVRLFHRTRHGVSLTAEGIRFKNEVLPLTTELDDKLLNFKKAQTEESGEIRLGCFSEVGMSFFLPLCLEFQRTYPKIVIDLLYESEQNILRKVQMSEIEFGIVSHPPIIEGIGAFPLLKQKIALIGPARMTNPTLEELEGAKYVAYERSDALLSEIWSQNISRRRKPRISTIVNSHRSILDAISQNGMVGALPLMSAREYIDRGLVRPLPGYELEIPLYLIHPQSEYMPRKNLALKQHLLRRCKEHRESL